MRRMGIFSQYHILSSRLSEVTLRELVRAPRQKILLQHIQLIPQQAVLLLQLSDICQRAGQDLRFVLRRLLLLGVAAESRLS